MTVTANKTGRTSVAKEERLVILYAVNGTPGSWLEISFTRRYIPWQKEVPRAHPPPSLFQKASRGFKRILSFFLLACTTETR